MTLEHDIRRLSAIPILAELDIEALRLIAFSCETRMFRTGDILFRQGEASDGGFVLLVGTVGLESSGIARPAPRVVGPGALIGERALLSSMSRPSTATAREPTTVLKITRRLFYRVLTEFPGSAETVRRSIARDLSVRLADSPG